MFHNVQGQYIHNALPDHTMLHAPTVELLTILPCLMPSFCMIHSQCTWHKQLNPIKPINLEK